MSAGGGFQIPAELIDAQASGLQLVQHVRAEIGARVAPLPPIRTADVKLADWLMTDPVILPRLLEGQGIDLAGLLSRSAPVWPEHAMHLGQMTGGAIRFRDWLESYSPSAAVPPRGDADAEGGGAVEPAAPPPIVHGRLGETPSGPLFQAVRWFGNVTLVTGLGVTLALDDSQLAALHAAAGRALARKGIA